MVRCHGRRTAHRTLVGHFDPVPECLGCIERLILHAHQANLFALAWGVANILCGLCFVRIGIALTGGILTGLGVSVGVTLPMIVKGSGLFSEAPSLDRSGR